MFPTTKNNGTIYGALPYLAEAALGLDDAIAFSCGRGGNSLVPGWPDYAHTLMITWHANRPDDRNVHDFCRLKGSSCSTPLEKSGIT